MDFVDNITKAKLERSAQWLRQSIMVKAERGSSHSYSYWLNGGDGWEKSYPETTGYIIPTLLQYSNLSGDKEYERLATACAEWLSGIQSEKGYFRSGVSKNGAPSVFNTAMILFGFAALNRWNKNGEYSENISRAINWILSVQENNGEWLEFGYKKDFSPAYYSRIVWALLFALKNTQLSARDKSRIKEACSRTHQLIMSTMQDVCIPNWGFEKGRKAYSHTIGYTLRGLWESAILMDEPDDPKRVKEFIERFFSNYFKEGTMPGSIDPNGMANYKFSCLTGNAQLGILLLRMGYEKGHPWIVGLDNTLGNTISDKGIIAGAVAGSWPRSGEYLRLKYPNWATKFYMDFLMAQLDFNSIDYG